MTFSEPEVTIHERAIDQFRDQGGDLRLRSQRRGQCNLSSRKTVNEGTARFNHCIDIKLVICFGAGYRSLSDEGIQFWAVEAGRGHAVSGGLLLV